MGRGDSESPETEYIKSTGCRHIQEVIARIEKAGFSLEEFKGTNAYEELLRTVQTGEIYGFEAAPRRNEDKNNSPRRGSRS
ncbi:MAG: hypothetical protein N2558_02415 [Patescibacteria group bacterium]|nr:hypothetical protein [Patescibacteria group bacterium]